MADLKLVGNAMFYKKSDWVNVPDEEKESCFFIFNRYFAKKFPEKSQLLNLKSIDKIIRESTLDSGLVNSRQIQDKLISINQNFPG